MTPAELIIADMGDDQQHRTRHTERTAAAAHSEVRSPKLGLLIILISAIAFYGGIAACLRHYP